MNTLFKRILSSIVGLDLSLLNEHIIFMIKDKLELRMYGLVNYQLTGIQKGIQFLHAVVEYQLEPVKVF